MHADTPLRRPESARSSRFDGPSGLSGELWPLHPHRLEDELLSSWIVRTGHANRLKLETFATLGFGRDTALWNRDIDRSASDALLERLGHETGSTVAELRGGMLSTYEGKLFRHHNVTGNTEWILPLGVYHRTRKRFGVQFCPLCLFFDPDPYFRRHWRLGFSTVCEVHGTMLHDRCPECGSPVAYFRNDVGRRRGYKIGDHVSCWRCGFDLRRAAAYGPSAPDGQSIMGLRSLVAFHELGWWFQGEETIQFGPLYFEALHHLLTVLPSARGRSLLDYIERETGWHAAIGDSSKRSPFECRPISTRHQLLVAALWLLNDWPERFVRAARTAGLSQARILLGEPLPFWFESQIRLNLGAGFGKPTAEEAKQAATYLVKTAKEVSGCAVGRLIGSRYAMAARNYAKSKPAPMTDAEFHGVIERLEAEIGCLPARSFRRLVLERDRTIFEVIQLTAWPVRKILRLTVGDAARLTAPSPEDAPFQRALEGLLLPYLRDTRPYLARDRCDDALFLGRRGSGIGGKTWWLRVWRAKRSAQGTS